MRFPYIRSNREGFPHTVPGLRSGCIGCLRQCRKTHVERTASPRRKEATAWSGGAALFGRGDPGERAGGDDNDAVASGPDRRPDPGGLGTPTSQSPYPLAQLGLGMIRSSPRFTRLRTSVSFAERLSHIGSDQLGIAFVAIWPLCKCLRAQKTWNLKFPYSRIRAKHVEVAAPSSSCRSSASVQPSFCVGCATQKLLIRFQSGRFRG